MAPDGPRAWPGLVYQLLPGRRHVEASLSRLRPIAGSDGSVTVSFTLGAGVLPGPWRITAYGNTSDSRAIAVFHIA